MRRLIKFLAIKLPPIRRLIAELNGLRNEVISYRGFIMVLGGAMMFVALVADWIGLSAPRSFGGAQTLLLSAGIVVFLIGFLSRVEDVQSLRSLGHWIADLYKGVAILILNTLVLVAFLELAVISLLTIWSLSSSPAEQKVVDPRAKLPYYNSQDWTAQYWQELEISHQERYRPYVVWRSPPFKGETININQDGIRLTPGADCRANSYKVFAFGGSTMWGIGSPDWGTIAAYLQTGLEALREGPVCVVNLAGSGFVSTQGVIELIMQLQAGNVPDLVLFYEGVNDTYAAYQSGRAGVHQNLDEIAARFDEESARLNMLKGFKGREPPHPLVEWLKTFSLFSLSQSFVARLRREGSPTTPKLVTYETMAIDTGTLSDSVAKIYLSNYKIVSALAEKYGFKYFFFWQPVISFGQKSLTREERDIRLNMDPALVKLYDSVSRTIEKAASKYENLYSMAKIFDHHDTQIWIDEWHTTPPGNQLIAKKMLDVVAREFHLRRNREVH